jgi:proteasome lid subunit RPN8/RPN11
VITSSVTPAALRQPESRTRVGREFADMPDDCNECPESKLDVIQIPEGIWNDILDLYKLYLPKEFAIYLIMEETSTGYRINDYVLPKQTVSGASVDINEEPPKAEIIGHFHSHATMDAFFSGQDRRHFNWPVHIVMGSKIRSSFGLWDKSQSRTDSYDVIDGHSIMCFSRRKLTCGRTMQKKAIIKIIYEVREIPIYKGVSPTDSILQTEEFNKDVIVTKTLPDGTVLAQEHLQDGTQVWVKPIAPLTAADLSPIETLPIGTPIVEIQKPLNIIEKSVEIIKPVKATA